MSAFSTGTPATLPALTESVAALNASAEVQYRGPWGSVSCFQVVVPSGNFAHLFRLLGQLKAAGYSCRDNSCGAVPSVLVREAVPAPEPTTDEAPPVAEPATPAEVQHLAEVKLAEKTIARMRRNGRSCPDTITALEARLLAKLAEKVPAPATYEPTDCSCDGRCLDCGAPAVFELRDETDAPGEGEPYCREHGPAMVVELIGHGWTHLDLAAAA